MAALEVRFEVDGEARTRRLDAAELRIGRALDNDIVLPDPSVSRRHAEIRRHGAGWLVRDLGSTNGVVVNQQRAEEAVIAAGDRLQIGAFTLEVMGAAAPPTFAPTLPLSVESAAPAPDAPAPAQAASSLLESPSSTLVRPLSELAAAYGLVGEESAAAKRRELDLAYGNRIFGYLTRLASLLLTADQVAQVLERVVGIAFEALTVDRGFILLLDARGRAVCELARLGGRLMHRPQGDVPVSRTILETVMRERVALVTYDAQEDARLAEGASIRMHQIRSAMCVPLWSGERIIGVMQVDSPVRAGSFSEADLAFLTALANYAAVAVERLRNAARAEEERRLRARLERYHSPAVIEDVLRQDGSDGSRPLKAADVSVLFADLSGFTSLAEGTDPTPLAEVLAGFFDTAVEAIFAAGGTLDKFIGDCVMAFFGAPMRQADHARRAVEAGLALQRGLASWNARHSRAERGFPELKARVGINSGPVVVGEVGSSRRVDYTVLGNTVNIAQRLEEQVAQVGEVVVGAETLRQLAGAFASEPLGEIALKGLRQPVAAFRIREQG